MFHNLRSFFGFPVVTALPAQAPVAEPIAKAATAPQLTLAFPHADAVAATAVVPAASIYTLIDSKDRFRYGAMFRYNVLTPRNLQERKGILAVIKNCERIDFMALPFERRKRIFSLLKQETARYNGTALRQGNSHGGKAGEPLPQLKFPTRQDAAAYRQLLQDAMRTISAHIRR